MKIVGILDDEVVICETLSKYLNELGYSVPDYALTYEEAIELIENHELDIMLLDINISGEKTGIDVAKYIREHHNIPLIFISSYSDKNTLNATSKVSPNGYLVKPFHKNDLMAAIETAISNFSNSEKKDVEEEFSLLEDAFFIKQNSSFVRINFDTILYVKSDGVYLEINTSDKKFLIRETLKNLQKKLPPDSFFQIHRSYIVSLKSISEIGNTTVKIGDETLPLSRNSREDFLKYLNLL